MIAVVHEGNYHMKYENVKDRRYGVETEHQGRDAGGWQKGKLGQFS